MATPRLYFHDPLLATFESTVVAHGEHGGRSSVVLAQTGFYPESGGQMADRGTLNGVPIMDVQVDDADVVHHLLDGGLPPVGASVRGEIDLPRRRLHMALHTAQHMLSRAFVDLLDAETVSARLGESECTIDLSRPALSDAELGAAEDLVHAVIDDDRPIRAFIVTPEELAELALRRAPKVNHDVRIVDIDGFDLSPCGGTHCLRTAQVGLVRIKGVERYKGKSRVTFAAGQRARLELAGQARVLGALAQELTCSPTDVAMAFEKLRRELGAARDGNKRTLARLADSMAAELVARPGNELLATFDGLGSEFLRALGTRVIGARAEAVAFFADRAEEHLLVFVARGERSDFDCGAFLKRVTAETGGRGGGRPQHGEARLPRESDWEALVRRHA